jgi:hypothetical protein
MVAGRGMRVTELIGSTATQNGSKIDNDKAE